MAWPLSRRIEMDLVLVLNQFFNELLRDTEGEVLK